MERLYQWNEEVSQWERVDRTQEFMGCTIQTLSVHGDYYGAQNHREYKITWPDGHISYHTINKRSGGNIADLRWWIEKKVG